MLSTVGFGQEVPGHCMNRGDCGSMQGVRHCGCGMAFELRLSGADPARPTWPGLAIMAGRAGRGCDYVAHRVPIKCQAWHYLICSGYYLSGIGAGSCPVQRCSLSIVGLVLAGTGHQAVPPMGIAAARYCCHGGCPVTTAAMGTAAMGRGCCFVCTTYICRRTRFLFSCACLAERLLA